MCVIIPGRDVNNFDRFSTRVPLLLNLRFIRRFFFIIAHQQIDDGNLY